MLGSSLWTVLASLTVGLGVALAARGTRALTRGGAAGAGAFAASLVGLGGWAWIGPGVAFFVPSSAVSFLPDGAAARARAPRRSLRQVLANGGVAWSLLIGAAVASSPPWKFLCYAGFVGSLAAAAADTWATEFGVRYAGQPWSLRTGRRVSAGRSGAVSAIGTLAGLAGAATVAGSAWWTGGVKPSAAVACAVAGLGGMGTDAWLGATLQAQYRDSDTGILAETSSPGTQLERGYRKVDNDAVNLFGTAAGAVLAALFVGVSGRG